MTKYIDVEKLKAEIKRRKELLENGTGHTEVMKRVEGAIKAYNSILAFLDTLQEQSVIKKSNALFDECVKNCDPAVMKEVSDNIDKMLGRQPVEGLEEEISRTYHDGSVTDTEDIDHTAYENIARHFAEWQKKLDDLETADLLAIAHLQGMEQQKSRMLADAVEGEISVKFPVVRRSLISVIDMPKDFKYGDKVSVIIIKED